MTKAIIGTVVVVAAAAIGLYVGANNPGWIARESGRTGNAPLQSKIKKIVAQGRLVPFGGVINVAGTPGDRIKELKVEEGSPVTKQETELAVGESRALLEIQTRLATAQKKDAELVADQNISAAEIAKSSAELAVKSAKLKLKQVQENQNQEIAKRQIANAQQKLDRMKTLATSVDTSNLVSRQEVLDQQLDVDRAKDQLAKATSELKRAEEAAQLAVETAESNFDSADKSLASAQAARNTNASLVIAEELATHRYAASKIVAPCNGTVLKIFVHPGESIVNTPLMQIGNTNKMECVAEVYQLNLQDVEINQPVIIKSPALDRELRGKVSKIGKVIGNATLPNPNPLALADKRTAEVRIDIEPDDVKYAAEFINLQVTVEIELAGTNSNR